MLQRKKKKIIKKVVVRSAVKKPSTTLIQAHGATCFWVHDGPVICDLKELYTALKTQKITEVQWKHHVQGTRNDFATWIQDVFRNEALALKFRKAKTKNSASTVLNTSLKR